MSTTIPITRSTRQVTLEASAAQTVFTFNAGPVWDTADLVVQRKIWPANRFTTITTGFTLAQTGSPAGATGATCTFSVAPRPTLGDAAVQIRIVSRRVHERETDVSRAGRLHTPSLETEHDKITTTLQELRRDVDQNDTDLRAELEEVLLGQIPDGSLPDTKLEDMPAGTVKANLSGAADVPGNVSVAALLAALAAFVGDAGAGGTKGVVPAPPVDAANEKRILGADGNWKLPTWLPAFIGDSGSGGGQGMVPAPAAGDAAAGKVLGAGGTWIEGLLPDGSLTAAKFPAAHDAVALPAIRKRLRQLPDIFDFGVTPSSTDFYAAIVAAHADSAVTTLFFPAEKTAFPVSTTLLFDKRFHLEGEGINQNLAFYDNSSTGVWWRGHTSSGGGIQNLTITHSLPTRTITGISKSNPAVVTYTGTDMTGISAVVISGVSGMTQVNGLRFAISSVTSTTFVLTGINSTAYGTYTSGGTIRPAKTTAILVGNGTESQTAKPDQMFFDNVNVTSENGVWDYGFLVNGTPYNGTTKSLGNRNGRLSNFTSTNTSTKALEMRQARGWGLANINCDTGNGVTNEILITGSESLAADGITKMRSFDVKMAGVRSGGITFTSAQECVALVTCYGTFTCASTAENIFGSGYTSAFTNAGTNCRFARGDTTSF